MKRQACAATAAAMLVLAGNSVNAQLIKPPRLGKPSLPGLKPKDLDPFNKNGKLREKARELDKKRLERIRAVENAAAEKAYYAYRDYYEGRNIKRLRRRLKPGTLVYDVVEPYFRNKLKLNKVTFRFSCAVPPKMAAITFGDRIYIGDSYKPDDYNQALLIAHELAHVMQYQRMGGEKQFARRYWGQIGKSVRNGKVFNIHSTHDSLGLEKEANEAANGVHALYAKRKKQSDTSNTAQANGFFHGVAIKNGTSRPVTFYIRVKADAAEKKVTLQPDKDWWWYVSGTPGFRIRFDSNPSKGIDAKTYTLKPAASARKPTLESISKSSGAYVFRIRNGERSLYRAK